MLSMKIQGCKTYLPVFPGILFEVGIPNLVCECILGWRSVSSHFLGHCDLDLISRLGSLAHTAYLLYSLRWESQIWCMDASLDGDMSCSFLGHCDLDL